MCKSKTKGGWNHSEACISAWLLGLPMGCPIKTYLLIRWLLRLWMLQLLMASYIVWYISLVGEILRRSSFKMSMFILS